MGATFSKNILENSLQNCRDQFLIFVFIFIIRYNKTFSQKNQKITNLYHVQKKSKKIIIENQKLVPAVL